MDGTFACEEMIFRKEVRTWLEEHAPKEPVRNMSAAPPRAFTESRKGRDTPAGVTGNVGHPAGLTHTSRG